MFEIDLVPCSGSKFPPSYLLAFIHLVASQRRRIAAEETSPFEPQWNGEAKSLKAPGNKSPVGGIWGLQERGQEGQ